MVMIDVFGNVHLARPSDPEAADVKVEGGWVLDAAPVAYVGPGRGLGHLSINGNLIVCEVLKVCVVYLCMTVV